MLFWLSAELIFTTGSVLPGVTFVTSLEASLVRTAFVQDSAYFIGDASLSLLL